MDVLERDLTRRGFKISFGHISYLYLATAPCGSFQSCIKRFIIRYVETFRLDNLNYRLSLIFYWRLGSGSADNLSNFRATEPVLNTNFMSSRPCDAFTINVLVNILTYAIVYVLIHHIILRLYLYFLNIVLYFLKYSCTNIFHKRSPYTFY